MPLVAWSYQLLFPFFNGLAGMADPLKVFTGLLDAIGEAAPVAKAAKPAATTGYFSSLAKTGADYFADVVKAKQNVPKPSAIPEPPKFKSTDDMIAELLKPAPAAPKPFDFAGQ